MLECCSLQSPERRQARKGEEEKGMCLLRARGLCVWGEGGWEGEGGRVIKWMRR